MTEDRFRFDAARAKAMIGKTVLMGITYFDHEGAMIERKQLYGVVVSAHKRQGVVVELRGSSVGETFTLPPDLRPFHAAPPGDYRLKAIPEVVHDPDFVYTCSITKAAPSGPGRTA